MLSARDPPSYKWFSPRSRSWPDDLGHRRPVCLLPIVAGQCPLPTDHSSFWARAIFDRGVLQGNRAPLLRLHRNYASPDARNADRQTARRATQNNAYVRDARFFFVFFFPRGFSSSSDGRKQIRGAPFYILSHYSFSQERLESSTHSESRQHVTTAYAGIGAP